MPATPQGTIVVLGGGHDAPLLAQLARLLPTPTAPLEVLTTATAHDPARTHAAYAAELSTLGYSHVNHLLIDEAHPADAPATLARLRAASLLLLTGGDQERLTDFLLGTEFLNVLRQRCQHDAGFVLAGTSAGAAALGTQMLVGGRGWRSLLAGGIDVLPGLDLLPGLLIDQHFVERARFPRLFHAVLAYPHLLGLGLNEETGLVFRPGRPPEVFGDETVVLVDGSQLSARHYEGLPPGQPVGGQGFQVSLLVAGDTFAVSSEQMSFVIASNAKQSH
ncbi:cyanophycinase [Hymenobacter sp. UV11]|nr:cyanophycinase [Hymenobacter sp. UV11]